MHGARGPAEPSELGKSQVCHVLPTPDLLWGLGRHAGAELYFPVSWLVGEHRMRYTVASMGADHVPKIIAAAAPRIAPILSCDVIIASDVALTLSFPGV